jgi:hypothetical protein
LNVNLEKYSILTLNDSFFIYNSQGNKISIDETNLNPEYNKFLSEDREAKTING